MLFCLMLLLSAYLQKNIILTSQIKKILSIALKVTIVVLAFWLIYNKLITNGNLKNFLVLIKELPAAEIFYVMGIVLLMMLINWGLEAIKWQLLIKRVEALTLWRAVESVFCGLTWAIFTPNRLGEYGGRVFFLSPKRRIVGIVAMVVGTTGQLLLTHVFGIIAVCVFVYRFTPIDHRLFLVLCAISTAFCLFYLIFYFNIKWLNGILLSMRITRKYKRFYAILARYKKAELLRILLLCLARYIVFSTQYFIMFLWLIPDLHLTDVLMLVCISFFVQSSLPSLDLLDIGVRSVTALFFFKYVTDQHAAVVACVASIWLINIIIPAILGSFFVFKLNFFGSTQRN